MYYAVLRKEIKMPCSGGELTLKVGGVYEVRRVDVLNRWFSWEYRSVDLMEAVPEPYGPWYDMPEGDAKEHFTKPKTDLNAVIEEPFLVCEAAYC